MSYTPEERAFLADEGWSALLWADDAPSHWHPALLDRTLLPYQVISATLHMLFMLLVLSMPPALEDWSSFERFAPPSDHVVEFDASTVQPVWPQPEVDHGDILGDGDDAALAHKRHGEEGQAGDARLDREDFVPKRMALAKKKRDRVKIASAPTPATLQEAGALGALSAYVRGAGPPEESLGQDTQDALGHLDDLEAGHAAGEGALGMTRGRASGGAGDEYEGAGIAHVLGAHTLERGGRGVNLAERLRGRAEDLRIERKLDEKVTHCLTQETIAAAVQRRAAQLKACYDEALMYERDLSGTMMLEMEIASSGVVEQLRVTHRTLRSPFIASCVQRKLADLQFPAFEGCARVKAKYPLRFQLSHGHSSHSGGL
ncbi:MAG: AgmX/PglI C-terminal domain-containing protein [Myxococcota bacterium]